MDTTPGADWTVVYSKLQFTDGSALGVAELTAYATAGGDHVIGNSLHVGLVYEDSAEQRTAFDKLAKDGEVLEALANQFWGAAYGAVRDKCGVICETNCCLPQDRGDGTGSPA
ncbi:VOC family protein [Streptomyces sp. NPDC001250]|uniref:VOC family protein n=1 Tax=unclassified Streptomyces TaxID=2593676 RepID=UPI0033178B54